MIRDKQVWIEKDRKYIWHAMSGYSPGASTMVITEGDGVWVTDLDGKRYLDGMSGLWCVNVGYGREELARAAKNSSIPCPTSP
jgi:taurine-pyruvate aminotransferase